MSHARFGEIRSMLHSQAPSKELWKTLTGLLWGWRTHLPQEAIAAYCDDLLESWPDELRVLPKSWLRAVLRGSTEPTFKLCRTVLIANRHIDMHKLDMLLSCETLNKVTTLDLSNNDFANDASSRVDWVKLLAQAPMASNLTRLLLRQAYLLPETLTALREVDLRALKELDLSGNYQIHNLSDFFRSPWAPSRLERLSLHHVIDDDIQEGKEWGDDEQFQRSRLRTSGLREVLQHTPIDHLDLAGCNMNPLPLAKGDALAQLKTLSCSITQHHEAWYALFAGEDLSALESLRITSFYRGFHVDLLEALRARVVSGDTPLRILELPQSVCVWQIFHTDYKELFEAKLDAVRVFDE